MDELVIIFYLDLFFIFWMINSEIYRFYWDNDIKKSNG